VPGLGEDPDRCADPFDVWRRLRAAHGPNVNFIDLYALVAHPRGLEPNQLSADEREQLALLAIPLTSEGFELIAGSGRGEREPIRIVPYDGRWPAQFAVWHDRLADALRAVARRIEHVGSTAVPGLPAKPIIDVQVSLEDLEDEALYVPAIESLGVQLRSRENERRYFRPFSGLPRDIHVHVCAVGSEWERRHLLFRDYLRVDGAAREACAAAKHRAAERWSDDRLAYTEAKDGTIREITAAADAWASRVGWMVSSWR
jgi:GrpB-like predicted nucleotidyltransferase (UPF0157 family)